MYIPNIGTAEAVGGMVSTITSKKTTWIQVQSIIIQFYINSNEMVDLYGLKVHPKLDNDL